MQIGSHILGNYENRIPDTGRTDSSAATAVGNSSTQTAVDLSGLKEGAVFKGEVLDILGDKVTISLENAAQLKARLQGDVQLGVGDQLLFSVKENTANQILIKPMFDSLYSAQTQVLERALEATGLSPTEKNFSAAKELMDAGMPLDKQSMVKLLSQSLKFPNADMKDLVTLTKMNVPINEQNLEQLGRYQNLNHQLSGDIQLTAKSMSGFVDMLPFDMGGKELLSLSKELVAIFSEQTEQSVTMDESEKMQPMEQMQNVKETGIVGESNQTQLLKQNSEELHMVKEQGLQPEEGKIIPEDKLSAEKDVSVLDFFKATGLSKEEAGEFLQTLQKTGVSGEQIQTLVRQIEAPEQFLQELFSGDIFSNASQTQMHTLLSSDGFKKLFEDLIQKNWALNPRDMKNPKEIDDLYEKIQKQGKSFEQALLAKGGDTKGFSENFQNTRQNMQFMEQLNQQMIYAQMPLKLSNQNANSELYVYADKRKLAQKKDGISVMLHLDMDHLGQTDVKVTLTGSNVHARFYLNDRESVELITNHVNELAKQLADRGFSLTNEVVERKPAESINKVVDEIIDENAEKSIKRFTFDART